MKSGYPPMYGAAVHARGNQRSHLLRGIRKLLVSLVAIAILPVLAGVVGLASTLRVLTVNSPLPVMAQPLPAPPIHDPRKPTAVVILGNKLTASTDAIAAATALEYPTALLELEGMAWPSTSSYDPLF